MMLNDDLIYLIMMTMIKDCFHQVKTKSNWSFKDELGGKIMIEFIGIRAETWAYLTEDGSEHKKGKGKKSV